jgi:hypothetical protein
MSKNAKAVRDAIEAKRLQEENKRKSVEQSQEFEKDEEIDHYSSDYGEEEAPPMLDEEEEDSFKEESSGYGDEDEADKDADEEGRSNPLLMMTSGIGQQLQTVNSQQAGGFSRKMANKFGEMASTKGHWT